MPDMDARVTEIIRHRDEEYVKAMTEVLAEIGRFWTLGDGEFKAAIRNRVEFMLVERRDGTGVAIDALVLRTRPKVTDR